MFASPKLERKAWVRNVRPRIEFSDNRGREEDKDSRRWSDVDLSMGWRVGFSGVLIRGWSWARMCPEVEVSNPRQLIDTFKDNRWDGTTGTHLWEPWQLFMKACRDLNL